MCSMKTALVFVAQAQTSVLNGNLVPLIEPKRSAAAWCAVTLTCSVLFVTNIVQRFGHSTMKSGSGRDRQTQKLASPHKESRIRVPSWDSYLFIPWLLSA